MSLSPIAANSSQLLDILTSKNASASPGSSQTESLFAPSGNVDLSDAAQSLAKLQNLSQTDPTKFKQLTAQISSELQTAAQNSTGSESTFLTGLSNQFKTASQTGSASPLEPQQTQTHAHGHHGGHHSASYAASAANDTSNTDTTLQSIFQQVSSA